MAWRICLCPVMVPQAKYSQAAYEHESFDSLPAGRQAGFPCALKKILSPFHIHPVCLFVGYPFISKGSAVVYYLDPFHGALYRLYIIYIAIGKIYAYAL